jgi:aryl-alcohol dehydrogenase-like predicted oxidoreductase
MSDLQLGLGLLSIGRPWGAANAAPPSRSDAFALLERAIDLGIRFFDTAPAYGPSGQIFGEFIRAHGAYSEITIATKFGEHWLADSASTRVDHSFEALKRSLATSLDRLGRIDLLQVHKATTQSLRSDGLHQALSHATSLGIKRFGASISDAAAADLACADGRFHYLQFPLSQQNKSMHPLISKALEAGITPIINRPLNMGHALKTGGGQDIVTGAFRFLKSTVSAGIVLTGTSKIENLTANVRCFRAA